MTQNTIDKHIKPQFIKNALIIENDETRIDWLTTVVPYNVNLHYYSVVKEFIDEFPKHEWDMVIFDCDLDPGNNFEFDDDLGLFVSTGSFVDKFDRDVNGQNGVDAARLLCDTHKNILEFDVPVVVWSNNPKGSYQIKTILDKVGFSNVKRAPYNSFYLKELEKAILNGLSCD